MGYKHKEIFMTFQSQSIVQLDANNLVVSLLKKSKSDGYAGLFGWGVIQPPKMSNLYNFYL